MKDYRTWWAKIPGSSEGREMVKHFQISPPMIKDERHYPNNCCMAEQLWAEREGLA